jgi:pyruvate-formate lyase-activating enzyme
VADNFAKSWDMLRLEILHQRNVRYVSFFGGEPLVHPHLADMIKMTVAKGMGPAVITNGWLLPAKLDQLAAAGLKTVYVSIDAAARWHRRFAILASRLSRSPTRNARAWAQAHLPGRMIPSSSSLPTRSCWRLSRRSTR